MQIFRHSEESPMLYGGQGETDFLESKGNFKINDYVTSRIPLTKVEVVRAGIPTVIKLSSNDAHYVSFVHILFFFFSPRLLYFANIWVCNCSLVMAPPFYV